jgi:type IV secretory pathway VirB2 component (pilin)
VAGVALIVAVSLATWWLVGPQSLEDTPPRPANLAEHVVGVVACVVAVAACVALVVAARTGRMDLRWRPTIVALSLAGVPAGWAVRIPLDAFGAALVLFGFTGLPLVVYGIAHIPPYWDPPRR